MKNSIPEEIHSGTGAIILAAGSSRRFGEDKLFLPLGGKPVLAWSLDVFERSPAIDAIVLVLNENNWQAGHKLAEQHKWSKLKHICRGGLRRQDSVKAGIYSLSGCSLLFIHDGARPFVSEAIINSGLEAVRETGAAVPAVPVTDTIKVSNSNNIVEHTLSRDALWSIQTPQVFRSDIIVRAYEQNDEDVTDDASLVEKMGYKVKLFCGSYSNIKITTSDDMELAQTIARKLE